MTPEFSRRADIVLDSPYWDTINAGGYSDEPPGEDYLKLSKEFRILRDAVSSADKYEDLKGEAKQIWDRAEPLAVAAHKEWEEFAAQDTGGYGRFLQEGSDGDLGTLVDESQIE